jgi:3-deoxy-manno-octulosonate cytidylyltransferase (CMP-KDO synthetase)
MNPIVLIPARMASTRLPDKPLALIEGIPMIVRVWMRAAGSGIASIIVACDSEAIASAVTGAGGRAILTDPGLPSGSDRIHAALQQLDPGKAHDVVINVQGDMPTLDPALIRQALALLENPQTDIGTLAAVITEDREKHDPAVVKAAIALDATGKKGRALYFSRSTIPHGEGPLYHHIGLYAYRRAALEKFVSLPPSPLEKREKLEQLRALEAGMRIDVAVADTIPLGVDTPGTLDIARKWAASHGG